jgi:hypothetical protein
MTSTPDRLDQQHAVHGPAEVRVAIVARSNEAGTERFDEQMDAAYREGPEAFRTYLDYWWACSQVAAGRGAPENFGLRPIRGGRQALIDAWEAQHPGEKLLDAA